MLSVRFEPPEFDPPQAAASRVSASAMNEERRRILAILGVRDSSGHGLPGASGTRAISHGYCHPYLDHRGMCSTGADPKARPCAFSQRLTPHRITFWALGSLRRWFEH